MRLSATRLFAIANGGNTLPSVGNVFVYTPDGLQVFDHLSRAVEVSEIYANYQISGFAYPGETLQSPVAGQWFVNNVPVIGQTSISYTVRLGDIGLPIRQGNSNTIICWHPNQIPGVVSMRLASVNVFSSVSPDIAASEGARVRVWRGLISSTSAENATVAQQPTFSSTGQAGLPAVIFESDRSSRLAVAGAELNIFNGVESAYTFVGYRAISTTSLQEPWSFQRFGGDRLYQIRSGNTNSVTARRLHGEPITQTPALPANTDYNIICMEALFTAGVLNHRMNGIQVGTANFPSAGPGQAQGALTGHIGAGGDGFFGWCNGPITCVINVNQTLSAVNRSRIERFIGLLGGRTDIPLV